MDQNQAANTLVRNLINAKGFDPYHYKFRPSDLPFCQLKHTWFNLAKEADKQPDRESSFLGDFYMNVGTAIHAVAQKWLGRLGYIFGYWVCPRCDTLVGPLLGEQICVCGTRMVYEEFRFTDPSTGFDGHCDGLLKIPGMEKENNDFVLAEIKSSSKSKIAEFRRNGIPYEYQLQISSYSSKIPSILGYNIVGVLFIFVPRDDPRSTEFIWWKKQKSAGLIFQGEEDQYLSAEAALQTEDYSNLTGICKSANDRHCPYTLFCFSSFCGSFFEQLHEEARGRKQISLPIFPFDETHNL